MSRAALLIFFWGLFDSAAARDHKLVRSLLSCEWHYKLRPWFRVAPLLLVLTVPAPAQEKSDGTRAANNPVRYQISATITHYCPIEKTVNLHPLVFDFHNNSCQESRRVSELKTPTLPQGPLYRNVRVAGYHFNDWSEGQPSPHSRNEAKIEISKTAATVTATGSLGKASCSKGSAGNTAVEETLWQAKVVPEVKLLEDEQRQPPPVTAEIVPPQSAAEITFSSTCASDREPSVQYSVTPLVDGVAQAEIYTSPLLTAAKGAIEKNGILGSASIHARWSPQTSGESKLTVTISAAAN